MTSRRAFLAASLFTGCSSRRTAGFPGYAYVANEEGRAVAVVDLTAFAVARHIPVAGAPTSVIARPGQPTVFVLTPGNGTVHEIDTSGLSFRSKTALGTAAQSMRLTHDGSALWVLCREPRALVKYPFDHGRPSRIALPAEPMDFDLDPEGRFAAVSFGAAGSVLLIDFTGRDKPRRIGLGGTAASVRFQSDGKQLLVANTVDRLLSVLSIPTGKLVVQLPLALQPDRFCFKADGGQLFITGAGMDAVAVVYPYRTEVAETVLAGRLPGAMAATTTADYDYLFVSNTASGDVTILDINERKAIARVAAGREPDFITVTPDGQYALILNRQSGDMAVIHIPAITVNRYKAAALFTLIPVGSRPVAAAVKAV